MPKIIKDLEKKIINCSADFFKENTYQDVCMKNIAEHLNIAVGTIYNYFPTKWELYIKIFEESWDQIYNKISQETNNIEQDYLKIFFTILYQEMFAHKLMVQKLFKYIHENNKAHKDKKKAIHKIIFNQVIITKVYDLFLLNLKQDYPEINIDLYQEEFRRLFIIIQTSIPTLFKTHSQNSDKNIDFIINLVHSYIIVNCNNK